MSKFETAMNQCTTTWNGAISNSSPDISGTYSGRMALFYKTVRGLLLDEKTPTFKKCKSVKKTQPKYSNTIKTDGIQRLYEYLRASSLEDLNETFLICFYIRDCRGGKGERALGRKALEWMFVHYPRQFMKTVPLIADYGRWDDLLFFFPNSLVLKDRDSLCSEYGNIYDNLSFLQECQTDIVKFVALSLQVDYEKMMRGESISLLAKWAPSEGDSKDKKYKLVQSLCLQMNCSMKQYRTKYLVPMRAYLNVVETYMCSKNWEKIDFSKVPSCAMRILKKAFAKHCPESFKVWSDGLASGVTKVNAGQLMPHELIREIRTKYTSDTVLEAQWAVLEQKALELGVLENALVVVDVSVSMSMNEFLPLDVATGLGLLISKCSRGDFKDNVITFHESPTFVKITGSTIYDRYKQLLAVPWGMSTNLQRVFDMILERSLAAKLTNEDLPSTIFIISDMQFGSATTSNQTTNFQTIETKYSQYGYKRPNIVFWNVNGATTDFPVTVDDNNTAVISGFSPAIMKAVIEAGSNFSPVTVYNKSIYCPRYEPVLKALTE